MNSLVLELQSEALDPSSSVSNLLRKASLIAYKLDVQELHEWVQLELNGYSEFSQLPDYRFVNGELKAKNPCHGLIPVMLDSAKISDLISKRQVCESISELEHLVSKNNSNFLYLLLPKELELEIQSWSRPALPLIIRVPTSQFSGIIERTKNIILNWSLRLEKDGILGEGMTFSSREKQVANHANYHVEKLFNYSSIGNTMSETKIEQNNSSIGVGVNQGNIKTKKLAGTINEAQSQNLVEAATEIQSLLEQLSATYPTTTSREKNIVVGEAVDQIENNPTLRAKVVNALKAGGTEAFKEANVDHPLVNILLATIEGWQQ